MFRVKSQDAASLLRFRKSGVAKRKSPLVNVERSSKTAVAEVVPYKNLHSGLVKVICSLFGKTNVRCVTKGGYVRSARLNRAGRRLSETKFYPDKSKIVVTYFDKDGKTPVQRIVNRLVNGKYEADPVINYPKGHKYPPKNAFSGVILRVKAKDLDEFESGVKQKVKEGACNIGQFVTESPVFYDFRQKVAGNKLYNWASQYLNKMGFDFPMPKGDNPNDILNVYILRSKKIGKGSLKLLRLVSKARTEIETSHYKFLELDKSGVKGLFFKLGCLVHAKFAKAPVGEPVVEEYLRYATQNSVYTECMKTFDPELLSVDYIPKNKRK